MTGGQASTLAQIALFNELPLATRQALEKRCSWRIYSAQ